MHILITDSGVGGLSVVAYAERFVRTQGFTEPVRLTFANAAPENDYGYNSMPSLEVKIATFDRFLRSVTERFAPDFIYVACNTLSVLRRDLPGIVETGVDLVARALTPDAFALIFATQTTTDSGAYPRLLQQRGIDPSRIISQACPGLADTISEDREGSKARAEIRKWVSEAMAKLPRRDAPIVACLACTHYGYRKEYFVAALGEGQAEACPTAGTWQQPSVGQASACPAKVINPNESAVADLFDRTGESHDVEVEVVSRYAIPQTAIETLTWLLQDISPRTVAALQNFAHLPDLF